MKKLTQLAAILFFAVSVMPGVAYAADPAPPQDETYKAPTETDSKLSHYASDDETDMGDGYVVPTFKNLSKLYWVLAMFDLGDNRAVDSYLMINQCDMYKKYFNNDFELEGLREATRQSIQKGMAGFPTKFEIMMPVGLDRYNIGTEKFMLDPRSQFISVRRLEVAVNSDYSEVCGLQDMPKYPRNFILSFNRPLTVTEIPVDPEVAQAYIEQQDKESSTHPYRWELSKFYRVAYLRFTVTMNRFKGYAKPDSNTPARAEIFGTIDGFEMYGDRDKTLLMFNQKMEKDRLAKRAGLRSVAVPKGQLIESAGTSGGGNANNPGSINRVSPETGQVEAPRFDIPSSIPAPAPAAK